MLQTHSLVSLVEDSALAMAIGQSMWIIATLSAVHVLAFTLSLGSALVLNARLAGFMLPAAPVRELAGQASRAITVGVLTSIATGLLLVSWKLGTVLPGSIFRAKMVLLAAAALLHFAWLAPRARVAADATALRLPAFVALLLWLGLGVAGCAFILFE